MTADKIIPICFDNDGNLINVAILSTEKKGGYHYTRRNYNDESDN